MTGKLHKGPGWAESILILTPVRLLLAGIFGFAAYLKLGDPQNFALAIKAFQLVDLNEQGHIVKMLVFGIPWTEMIIAVCLILGFWTRSAAALLTLMLLGFTGGMISLIARKIDTECACFGEMDFICSGAVGACHIGRNTALMLLSLLLVWRGGGRLALDQRARACCNDRPPLDSDDDDA